jgi:hypothetical protein
MVQIKSWKLTNVILVYTISGILLAVIMLQQQTVANSQEGTNNQTAKPSIVIPESPVYGNTTESEPRPETVPEEPSSNGDVIHCAALGCPGNPPNPHGPPTEEPQENK